MLVKNPTSREVSFSLDGRPGQPPTVYRVAPGGTCEVPDGYWRGGIISAMAPALVECTDPVIEVGGVSEPLAEAADFSATTTTIEGPIMATEVEARAFNKPTYSKRRR